jgi:uncharacterized membrane protein
MPSDNVTPFRRPPPRPIRPQQSGGGMGLKTHRGKVVLVHVLTIAAFALNLAFRAPPLSFIGLVVGIAGIVLAYSNRGEAMPWANTHHEHAMRTLVIGYAIWVLGSVLTLIHGSLVVVTIFVWIAVALWAGLRALAALVLGVMRKPIPHPHGWFI